MNHQSFRHGLRMAAVAAAACVSLSAHAGLVTWTITGPGITSASQAGDTATLNYSQPGSAGYASQTWAIRAVADTSGNFNFDWDYTGFHSFFGVTAFLTTTLGDTLVNAGPANCCSSPSSGFSYNGSYTFTGLTAGQSFGFNVGGAHFDSTQVKQGTVTLKQIPEPTSLALAGLALLGLAAASRRRA